MTYLYFHHRLYHYFIFRVSVTKSSKPLVSYPSPPFHSFLSLSCSLPLSPAPSFPFIPLYPNTPFLTLDEVQLCQEFEFLGDIQLEVSEGWISSQSEMLEILNCFTQPGGVKKKGKSVLKKTRRSSVCMMRIDTKLVH